MIYYPGDYVLVTNEYDKFIAEISNNYPQYDSEANEPSIGVPLIYLGRNYGHWENYSNVKKINKEDYPEYFI